MRNRFLLAAAATMACSNAFAQTPLSAYVDSNGFINVQTLTCAQLAGTFQEDADALTTWYSGWYNGLAKKHYLDFRKGKVIEHEVIQYCKANPGKLIIDAIAGNLSWIAPHVRREVFVPIIHAGIADCHYHVAAAGRFCPGVGGAD